MCRGELRKVRRVGGLSEEGNGGAWRAGGEPFEEGKGIVDWSRALNQDLKR